MQAARSFLGSRCQSFFSLIALIVLVTGVAVTLVLCLQEEPRVDTWGGERSILSTSTRSLHRQSRELAEAEGLLNDTTSINTTIFVTSQNSSAVEFIIVIGNVTYEQDSPKRLLGDLSTDNMTLDDVPLVKVVANPTTGVIYEAMKNSAAEDMLAAIGMNIIREVLVNQDTQAYGGAETRLADGECPYADKLRGDVFCPQFSQETTETARKYRRTYTTASIQNRRLEAEDGFNMNITIETSVDPKTGLLTHSSSTGEVTLPTYKDENGTSTTTLSHESFTSYNVNPQAIPMQDLNFIKTIVSKTQLVSFNETESIANTTRRLASRQLECLK